LVEEQVRKDGALTKANIDAQNKADEERIRQMNTKQVAAYISARTIADKQAEDQARAALQRYYKKVLEGKDEKQARHKLTSTLSYESEKIRKEFQKNIKIPEKPPTPQQDQQTIKAIEKYGAARYISSTTETLRESELRQKAIQARFLIDIKKGVAREEAEHKRDSQLGYEGHKASEEFNIKLNQGKLKIINDELRTDQKIIRTDLFTPGLVEPITEVDKKGKLISAPKYILTPELGEAKGISRVEAYQTFLRGEKKAEKLGVIQAVTSYSPFELSNLGFGKSTKKKARAIAYRTTQNFYSKTLGGLGSNVAADIITYSAMGLGTSSVAKFMLQKPTTLAAKTFKGLSAVAGGAFVVGTGAKYGIYEASLMGTPEQVRATQTDAPNPIEDIIKVASFTVGLKSGMAKPKKARVIKAKKAKELDIRGLKTKTKEYYPAKEYVSRSRSAKSIEKIMVREGFAKVQIKEFLYSRKGKLMTMGKFQSGKPVVITEYFAPKGQKAIGGIKKGVIVTIDGTSTGWFISKGYRATISSTPKATRIRFLNLKTGKISTIIKPTPRPTPFSLKEGIVSKAKLKLLDAKGLRGDITQVKGEAKLQRIYSPKKSTIGIERVKLSRTINQLQWTSAEAPVVSVQRFQMTYTSEGISWQSLGKSVIPSTAPKIRYGKEKLLSKELTYKYQTKSGVLTKAKIEPGAVFSKTTTYSYGKGEGQILEIKLPKHKIIDATILKLIADKRGVLLSGTEQLLKPPQQIFETRDIIIPETSIQSSFSGFEQFNTGFFSVRPVSASALASISSPRYDTLILPYHIQRYQPTSKEKIELREQTISRQDINLKMSQIPIQETVPVQEQKLRTGQVLSQQQPFPPLIPISPITPVVTRIPRIPEAPRTPFLGIPKLPKFEREKRKGGLFDVLVRRKGKFKKIATVPTPEIGFRLGRKRVEKTAAASFKVTPAHKPKRPILSFFTGKKFYASKKEPGVFIQKNRFRIGSFGEKKEIPGKALLLKKVKNIFRR